MSWTGRNASAAAVGGSHEKRVGWDGYEGSGLNIEGVSASAQVKKKQRSLP